MFSTNRLRNQMERVFVEHGRDFCDLIGEMKPDSVFDLQKLFFAYTMDSICEIAFGKRLNSLRQEVPFANAFDRAQELTVRRFFMPFQAWRLLKVFNIGSERELGNCVRVINDFVRGVIEENLAAKVCKSVTV